MEVEVGNGATVKTYLPNGLGVEIDNGGTAQLYYTHLDRLGSVVAISDQTGNLTESLAYDSWGKRRAQASPAPPENSLHTDNKGFTGHEMLDQLDLVHMNGRVYDPLIARFISADPIIQDPTHSQSYNRYTYVWNNPTNLTDPTGFRARDLYAEWDAADACLFTCTTASTTSGEVKGTTTAGTTTTTSGTTKTADHTETAPPSANSAEDKRYTFTTTVRQDGVDQQPIFKTTGTRVSNYADQAMGEFFNLNLAERAARGLGASEQQAFWIGLGVSMIGNPKQVLSSIPKGGTYLLRNAEGAVMRTGRSKDLARRALEHGRDAELKDLSFEVVHRTDVRSEQRGLEQMLHDAYDAPLNAIRPISPRNPRMDEYMDAARGFIERLGGQR
jgi:RHS repeat-associated protein